MLFLLLLYHLSSAGAVPISLDASTSSSTELAATPTDPRHTRTLANIIWSCLSTIIGSTWIAIHPNVPEPEEEVFKPRENNPGTTRWSRAGFAFKTFFTHALPDAWSKVVSTLRRFVRHKLPPFIVALLLPEYILAWAIRQWLMANELKNAGSEKGVFVHIYLPLRANGFQDGLVPKAFSY